MLEVEKNEKNSTVDKLRTLFNKIKNFEQLKEEVFEMKKIFQQTYEDVKSIQGKFSNMNDKVKGMNKYSGGALSFEEIQENNEFKHLMKKKVEEYDKKFNIVLGDFKINEDNNENINTDREKNKKKTRKNKLFNIIEINRRVNEYQQSKVNTTDFELKNEEYKNNINEIERKLDDLLTNLYGTNYEEKEKNIEGTNTKKFLFATKNEFERFKTKTDDEIRRIWEKIEELNKLYEEIFSKVKDNCTINDLESMKNLILDKTQELFLNLKNKNIDNSSILTLQTNFNKLLRLLAEKEENENWLLAKKSIGGHSCASCENYLGLLKDDTDRYVHWKKMPIKIKDKDNILHRVGNGYSRLLRMINFDKNGIPSLNPLNNKNEYFSGMTSNVNEDNKIKENELNKSGYNQSIHSITSKFFPKEKSEIINDFKTRNKLDKNEKRLPNIQASNSSDYFDKNGKKINTSTSNFNFKSPRLTRNNKKSRYKFDL